MNNETAIKQEFTLDNVISERIYTPEGWKDFAPEFTQEMKDGFLEIFGDHCSQKTKDLLKKAINENFYRLRSYGIFKRVVFNGQYKPCEYIAGQDYPGEVTYIRNLIKKYY